MHLSSVPLLVPCMFRDEYTGVAAEKLWDCCAVPAGDGFPPAGG